MIIKVSANAYWAILFLLSLYSLNSTGRSKVSVGTGQHSPVSTSKAQ